METPATYIYCNRFEESKSVLICATRCAYSLGCKDWATALSGELRGRIESEANEYAAKKGVVIDPDVWNPLLSRRRKRLRVVTNAGVVSTPASWRKANESGIRVALEGGASALAGTTQERSKMGLRPTASVSSSVSEEEGSKVMANEERISEVRKQQLVSGVKELKPKVARPRVRKRVSSRSRACEGSKGSRAQSTIYLVLERNGRYREVKSEEEMKRIAIEHAGKNRKGIRFVRGTLLEVEVMFHPVR